MSFERIKLLGVRVDRVSMIEVLDWAKRCISLNRLNQMIVVINVAKLVSARENSIMFDSIETADLVTADGMPLFWYSKTTTEPLPQRVAGPDIMMRLFEKGNEEKWSFYLLGASPTVIQQTFERLRTEYPNVRIAGHRDGYFSVEEESLVVEDISHSNANILLLGFGSPKKEIFEQKWRDKFGVNIILGVGGSFDVFAGKAKRAPQFVQNVGMEWFYRLIQEPVRMFPRYFVTNTKFIWAVMKDLMHRKFVPLGR
jgi:N-acetylglucosaminyldiphosphoundecaprenol N-acetyl-beta-D-mannosaminyltransferase